MSATADSQISVYVETREQLRKAAALMGCTEAELVGRAVDEYVERHPKRFAERMEDAQRALLGGKAAALAYSCGIGEADVERLGGVDSERSGRLWKLGRAAKRTS